MEHNHLSIIVWEELVMFFELVEDEMYFSVCWLGLVIPDIARWLAFFVQLVMTDVSIELTVKSVYHSIWSYVILLLFLNDLFRDNWTDLGKISIKLNILVSPRKFIWHFGSI